MQMQVQMQLLIACWMPLMRCLPTASHVNPHQGSNLAVENGFLLLA